MLTNSKKHRKKIDLGLHVTIRSLGIYDVVLRFNHFGLPSLMRTNSLIEALYDLTKRVRTQIVFSVVFSVVFFPLLNFFREDACTLPRLASIVTIVFDGILMQVPGLFSLFACTRVRPEST